MKIFCPDYGKELLTIDTNSVKTAQSVAQDAAPRATKTGALRCSSSVSVAPTSRRKTSSGREKTRIM